MNTFAIYQKWTLPPQWWYGLRRYLILIFKTYVIKCWAWKQILQFLHVFFTFLFYWSLFWLCFFCFTWSCSGLIVNSVRFDCSFCRINVVFIFNWFAKGFKKWHLFSLLVCFEIHLNFAVFLFPLGSLLLLCICWLLICHLLSKSVYFLWLLYDYGQTGAAIVSLGVECLELSIGLNSSLSLIVLLDFQKGLWFFLFLLLEVQVND